MSQLALRFRPQPDRIQKNDGDLALGFLRVVGIWRPELHCLFPQAFAFGARCGPGLCLHLFRADLHLHIWIGEQVFIPTGVLRCAASRCDDYVAVALVAVEQRADVFSPEFRPAVVSSSDGTCSSE
jgi:hypothetical protein